MKSSDRPVLDSLQFPSYRTEERRQELQRLGLSPPLVRLALFDLPHPSFGTRCDDLGPYFPEWRHDHQPLGAPVTWLWCIRRYHQLVTGVRVRGPRWLRILSRLRPLGSRLEFILFRPDALDRGHVAIAYSEQGLLASIFSGMIADVEEFQDMVNEFSDTPLPREEWEPWEMERLREAAESVGFQRFAEVQASWRQFGNREDYNDLLYAYTRSIT